MMMIGGGYAGYAGRGDPIQKAAYIKRDIDRLDYRWTKKNSDQILSQSNRFRLQFCSKFWK